jgi:DNA-directed RNA polymerase subunit RPC12/RpoP
LSSILLFIYECRFKVVLALALLGITLIIIPNMRIMIFEFDNSRVYIETFNVGLAFLISVLIVYLIPVIIPPKREFRAESFRVFCPNCGSKLIVSESSFKCPDCGYSINGDVSLPASDLVSILDLALTGCGDVCLYAQRIGECNVVRKYAETFNLSPPRNCPFKVVNRKR